MRIPFRPYPPMAEADQDGGQQNWKIELKGVALERVGEGWMILRSDHPLSNGWEEGWRDWDEMKWTCTE